MISGLNICTFSGNAGKDAELKYSKDGKPIGQFSIAVNPSLSKDRERSPMWLTVTAFGQTAEFCGSHIKKGNNVVVTGRLEYQTWDKPDGSKGSAYVVIASDVRKNYEKDEAGAGSSQPASAPRASAPANGAPAHRTLPPAAPVETLTDDDVPF